MQLLTFNVKAKLYNPAKFMDNFSDEEIEYPLEFMFVCQPAEAQEYLTLLGRFTPGYGMKKGPNGEWIYTRAGPKMPLHITIYKLDGNNQDIVYDKQFSQYFPSGAFPFEGGQFGVNVGIDSVKFYTGQYRVRLETLDDVIPKLANTPVIFQIQLHGK